MSTTVKIGYLRLLRQLGRKSLVATSTFGFPYRISLGDAFSENPFFNPHSNVGEILACAAWVDGQPKPVIFDIGAHCGFIATQLAQILMYKEPMIYSFEPVAPTFSDLVLSINELGLQEQISPIPAALGDTAGFVTLNYSKWNSMLAQVVPSDSTSNNRSGNERYVAPASTLDEVLKSLPMPHAIKIDVEGWEVPVFRGAAQQLLSPEFKQVGICLEWNPEALVQVGFSPLQLQELLGDYRFFYINDYEGQRFRELEEIESVNELKHVCNLFAIRNGIDQVERWRTSFDALKSKYRVSIF